MVCRSSVRFLAGATLIALAVPGSAQWGWTTLASRSQSLGPADGASGQVNLSHDARFVSFSSSATNLVAGDTNNVDDVFVVDSWFGGTTRVSVDSNGEQGNGPSGGDKTGISGDGRYVLFSSWASNLVPGDTNGAFDVFLHDRATGSTRRVSVDGNGQQLAGNSDDATISADGRYVAFDCDDPTLWPGDTNGKSDVFVIDTVTGTLTCASVDAAGLAAHGESTKAALSADGRWIAFTSTAADLAPGDGNGTWDTFLRDLATGQTWLVSVDSSGAQANGTSNPVRVALSADGRLVVFLSVATNLVPGDTNGVQDVFVHDHATGATERVSTDSTGGQADGPSAGNSISADGRYVTFGSYASNLVPDDTNGMADVFVKDRMSGATMRASLDENELQGDGASTNGRISGDGRIVAFQSLATNLVPGDTNGAQDVFLRDWQVTCGPLAGTYCVAMINSTGQAAYIDWHGTTQISRNDFELRVEHCPPGRNGIFFFGCYETAVPFGEGMLCVTGFQRRLPIVRVDANGLAACALDFTDPTSNASTIEPYSTWKFQFWYRDPQPVGHGFNLSNALSAQFCP
jgi:Tol biopolymer transport system component